MALLRSNYKRICEGLHPSLINFVLIKAEANYELHIKIDLLSGIEIVGTEFKRQALNSADVQSG
jgi:hypothetical protein